MSEPVASVRPKRSTRKNQQTTQNSDESYNLPPPMRCDTDDTNETNTQTFPTQSEGASGDSSKIEEATTGNLKEMMEQLKHEMVGMVRGVIQDMKPTGQNNRPSSTWESGDHRSRGPRSHFNHDTETSDDDSAADGNRGRNPVRGYGNTKLPAFTGKETWVIWFNRFREVADLKGWNNREKLGELLPRLQGVAGDFVYGQLSHDIRTNYPLLVEELNNRFRVVETRKTFGVKFNNRVQKPNESVEDFAADLKMMYDKAHGRRDPETRREDLVRKFLDGLCDERTRFHVEFVKNPENIDQAVDEVVNFQETRRRPNYRDMDPRNRKPVRKLTQNGGYDQCDQSYMVRPDEDDGEDEDEGEQNEQTNRVARVPAKTNKTKIIQPQEQKEKQTNTTKDQEKSPPTECDYMAKLIAKIDKLEQEMVKWRSVNKNTQKPYNKQPMNNDSQSNTQNKNFPSKPRGNYKCYRCGREDHFIRDCPFPVITGHMQMAVQPQTTSTDTPKVDYTGCRQNRLAGESGNSPAANLN